MSKGGKIFIIIVGSVFILGYLLTRPFVFFSGDSSVYLAFPSQGKGEFTIRFIHSVQKTPVEENLRINLSEDGFDLKSTRYQSFGVGLPFLPSEGAFRREGDYFIFDHMDRPVKDLALRFIESNQFTVLYQGKAYPLYLKVQPGSKISVRIKPYYWRFFR